MSRKSDPPKKSDKPDPYTVMCEWMDKVSSMIKDGFERQLEILQVEIFNLKNDFEKERTKREVLETENQGLRDEVRCIYSELDYNYERSL